MSISPISKITFDSLLLIFEAFTRQVPASAPASHIPSESRPLDNIRAASQVCRCWRESLLASPWIWGRVVDLDIQPFGQRRSEWMEEVVKRAGSSPLWIFGQISVPNRDSRFDSLSFFIRLLESWERVEVLLISISSVGRVVDIPEAIQTKFLSRAPILRHFQVRGRFNWQGWDQTRSECDSSDSQRRLFADHAPCLRTMNGGHLPFHLDSPWLSGIRQMTPIPTQFTVKEILTVLQQMPLLRRFVSQNPSCSSWELDQPLPSVHLPKVTSIALIFPIAHLTRILEHLSFGSKLSSEVIMWIIGHGNRRLLHEFPDIVPTLKKHLSRWISDYFTSNVSTNVGLTITETCLTFWDISKHKHIRSHPDFEVRLLDEGRDSMDWNDTEDIMVCILDSITEASTLVGGNPGPDPFGSVNEITLNLWDTPYRLFGRLCFTLAIFDRIRYISIDVLSASKFFSICFPDQADGGGANHGVLFPELHTFYLIQRPTSYPSENLINRTFMAYFALFLLKRKKKGYPLARFDLTKFGRSDSAPDLDCLEQIDGLAVTWKQSVTPPSRDSGDGWEVWSYVCGGGNEKNIIASNLMA